MQVRLAVVPQPFLFYFYRCFWSQLKIYPEGSTSTVVLRRRNSLQMILQFHVYVKKLYRSGSIPFCGLRFPGKTGLHLLRV
ncbi:hypothetical protein CS542_10805 [Pedobacter sp. IW39]|nr:hypothetical protein CS542_10805 [Pedobacter sp. IW39]